MGGKRHSRKGELRQRRHRREKRIKQRINEIKRKARDKT